MNVDNEVTPSYDSLSFQDLDRGDSLCSLWKIKLDLEHRFDLRGSMIARPTDPLFPMSTCTIPPDGSGKLVNVWQHLDLQRQSVKRHDSLSEFGKLTDTVVELRLSVNRLSGTIPSDTWRN